MYLKYLCVASFLLATFNVFAQARIIDSKPLGDASVERTTSAPRAMSDSQSGRVAPAQQADLYYQLQLLQEEVQNLRGLVEQQSYELKRLKQQRLDDYLDLDRRISSLNSSESSVSPTSASDANSATSAPLGQGQQSSVKKGEFASYQEAIGLALKKRDFDGSLAALQDHLKAFPGGSYEANAQYWLGQIYLQKGQLELSKKWFSDMTQAYPKHRKTQEAKFKLGKVLHKLGDTQAAMKLLKEVASTESSAANLAQDYLDQSF